MSERSFDSGLQAPRAVRFALTGLFVLAALYTLYFARAVLIPVALAIFLSWVLSPAVRGLRRRLRLPAPWGAALVVGALVAAIGYGAAALTEPAKAWIDKAPGMLRQVESKLRHIRQSVKGVSQLTEKAEQIAGQTGAEAVAVVQPSLFSRTLTATPAFLVSALSTLILAYLLLAYGGLLMRRFLHILSPCPSSSASECFASTSRHCIRWATSSAKVRDVKRRRPRRRRWNNKTETGSPARSQEHAS